MDAKIYRLPKGHAVCDLKDSRFSSANLEILELSAAGVLVKCSVHLPSHYYLDTQIRWGSEQAIPLFACVLRSDSERLRLRWVHFNQKDLESFITLINKSCEDSWLIGTTSVQEPKQKSPTAKNPEPSHSETSPTTKPLDNQFEHLLKNVLSNHESSSKLEGELRHLITSVLELKKESPEHSTEEHDDSIDLLERKISRLANSLNQAEGKIVQLQKGNIRATEHLNTTITPGLKAGDPSIETKKALLKALIDENLDLRSQLDK